MTATDILLRDVREALLADVRDLAARDDVIEAFAAWLLDCTCGLSLTGPATAAAACQGAQRTYRECAKLGFAADVLDDTQREVLRSSLLVISGREPFVGGQPMPYCSDVVALLGIALGAKSLGDDHIRTTREWMEKFAAFTRDIHGLQFWERCLAAAASELLATPTAVPYPRGAEAAAARVALRSRGLRLDETSEAADSSQALTTLLASLGRLDSAAHAALALKALDWLSRTNPTVDLRRPSLADVVEVLRGVAPALRKWTWEDSKRTKTGTPRQWHIDNEYHVQNLLFAVLRPIFPDLDDEEFTKKVGPKQPKADLCIPSLQLIVEVKFWRPGDSSRKILGEIAEDASLYLRTGSPYSHVVPFIWDDAGRGDEHDQLVAGLSTLPGVPAAVILSRPARFS